MSEQDVADMALAAARASLPNAAARLTAYQEQYEGLVREYVPAASGGAIEELRDALAATPAWPGHFAGSGHRAVVQHMPAFAPGLARWIRSYEHDPSDVFAVVAPLISADPPSAIGDAVREHVGWWRKEHDDGHHDDFHKPPADRVDDFNRLA